MNWLRFASFWAYPLMAAALLAVSGRQNSSRSGFEAVAFAFFGLLLWTFLEYCLHRFLFHWVPRNRRARRFLATLHLRHHGDPRNRDAILVRPRYSAPVSAVVFAALWLAAGDFAVAVWTMSGVWAGFLYYELVHYRVHLSKRGGGLLGFQRQGHFYHHFVDDEHCFGVTSPLWDLVFRTYRRVGAAGAVSENRVSRAGLGGGLS